LDKCLSHPPRLKQTREIAGSNPAPAHIKRKYMKIKTVRPKKIKGPRVDELKKKLEKIKGNFSVSRRKTWFSEAMDNLQEDKQ